MLRAHQNTIINFNRPEVHQGVPAVVLQRPDLRDGDRDQHLLREQPYPVLSLPDRRRPLQHLHLCDLRARVHPHHPHQQRQEVLYHGVFLQDLRLPHQRAHPPPQPVQRELPVPDHLPAFLLQALQDRLHARQVF